MAIESKPISPPIITIPIFIPRQSGIRMVFVPHPHYPRIIPKTFIDENDKYFKYRDINMVTLYINHKLETDSIWFYAKPFYFATFDAAHLIYTQHKPPNHFMIKSGLLSYEINMKYTRSDYNPP